MCPICWINGLVALLISFGVMAIDSPYTIWLMIIAGVLTVYSMWKFWKGFKKWKGFDKNQRIRNWKTIKRFTQGIVIGSLITIAVFYSIHWPAIDSYHEHDKETHDK